MARQRKAGPYGTEIRIPVTAELQRRLRHHAADHTGGSIATLSRSALEWITDELDAGRIPWGPPAPDPAE
jgi:hypothetical protein